jgi:hypothetical protein
MVTSSTIPYLALAVAMACASPALGQDIKDLVRRSSLVVEATLVQPAQSATAGVPAAPDVAVARVERVLEKPAAVALAPGQLITIKLKGPDPIPAGARFILYAKGRVYADTIAVEEVGHVPVQPAAAAAGDTAGPDSTARQVAQARTDLNNEQLKNRIEAAAAVIVGRVKEVRLPAPGQATMAQGGRLPVSEHDPDMREAVVEVQDGIKGAGTGQSVVVRFPASRDMQWNHVPKLQTGQVGTFVLHPENLTGMPTAAVAGAEVPAYTFRQRSDVLPVTESEKLRALVK